MTCPGNGVGCIAGEAGAGAVVQSLQTDRQMLAAIMWLQPPHVILFWFLACLRRVRADADTPANISLVKATPLFGGSSGSAKARFTGPASSVKGCGSCVSSES